MSKSLSTGSGKSLCFALIGEGGTGVMLIDSSVRLSVFFVSMVNLESVAKQGQMLWKAYTVT